MVVQPSLREVWWSQWTAPAIPLAKTVLDGVVRQGLGVTLTDLWAKAHTLIKHNLQVPIDAQPPLVGICCRIGSCVCGRQFRKTRELVRRWKAVMHVLLAKDSAHRALYESCALILELTHGSTSVWYSAGNLNLSSMEGSLMLLRPAPSLSPKLT